jgi:L-tartrate/succinate antiporter
MMEPLPGAAVCMIGVTLAAVLALWIFGDKWINATTVTLVVIAMMLVTGVVTWDDMLGNRRAWDTLVWFATLVALADGLHRIGFVKSFAESVAAHMGGVSPAVALVALVAVFFFTHYLFASITAHATALLPVMLAVGAGIPAMNVPLLATMLVLTLGIMGILTPYLTGPSPIYYGSGYVRSRNYWRLGPIFGAIFIAALIVVGVPWFAVKG